VAVIQRLVGQLTTAAEELSKVCQAPGVMAAEPSNGITMADASGDVQPKPRRQPAQPQKEPQALMADAAPQQTELPHHIQAFAELATQYPRLSLNELAQLAYDRGLYRATAKDGTETPVNRGTLQRWLSRAKEAGLL
jgi:hypothetical protein